MSIVLIARYKNRDRHEVVRTHDEVAARINELARSLGAVHHHVYYSEQTREGVVIDEWQSPEGPERLFSSAEFQSALADSGMGQPDEILFLEPVSDNQALQY